MAKRSEKGGVGVFLLVVILGYAAWAGYNVGQLYFDKSTIENEVGQIINDALLSKRGGVREAVARLFTTYGATYDPEKIAVDMNSAGTRMTVTADYERGANLGFTQYPIAFHIDIQKEQTKGVGVLNAVQESVEDSYNNSAQRIQKGLQQAAPQAPTGE